MTLTDEPPRNEDPHDPVVAAGRHTARNAALAVALVMVAFVAVLATKGGGGSDTSYEVVGKPAPAIQATSLAGEPFDLNDHQGKWVVVNFFSTTCGPCIDEHPELVRWEQMHRPTGDGALVSVVFNEDAEPVREFFDTNGGEWPVLPNADGSISTSYGVVKLPESYLVDPDGRVRWKHAGALSVQRLESKIAELSAEPAA